MPGLYQQTGKHVVSYRAAAWIGYYWLLPDIIGYNYFPYSFKIHELSGRKNVWK